MCECKKKEIKASSDLLRKHGTQKRGSNKVQRYRCKLCGKTLTFKRKVIRKETRGRPLSVTDKKKPDFKHSEDYYLIQIAGKASRVSGYDFYRFISRFTGLSKKKLGPKISRNIKFSSLDICFEALEYYSRFYLGMYKGKVNIRREKMWCSHLYSTLLQKTIEQEYGPPAEAMFRAGEVIRRKKQQPLFARVLDEIGVFNEFDLDFQLDTRSFSDYIEKGPLKRLIGVDVDDPILRESFLYLDIAEVAQLNFIKRFEVTILWETVFVSLPSYQGHEQVKLKIQLRGELFFGDLLKVKGRMFTHIDESGNAYYFDFFFYIKRVKGQGLRFVFGRNSQSLNYCKFLYMKPCFEDFLPRDYLNMRYLSKVSLNDKKRLYTYEHEIQDAHCYWIRRLEEQEKLYATLHRCPQDNAQSFEERVYS